MYMTVKYASVGNQSIHNHGVNVDYPDVKMERYRRDMVHGRLVWRDACFPTKSVQMYFYTKCLQLECTWNVNVYI